MRGALRSPQVRPNPMRTASRAAPEVQPSQTSEPVPSLHEHLGSGVDVY